MATRNGKTANKTAKPSGRNGNRLPLGAHPGNTGGKPGRSGRPPKAFKKFCREAAKSPEYQDALLRAATDDNHNDFIGAAKLIANYAASKPPKKVEHINTTSARIAERN
jgi:hypothetical protein